MRYFLANWLLAILPPTRLFPLKRMLLKACGINVGTGTRVCGGTKFYGAGKVSIGKDCWIGLEAKFHTAEGADIEIGDRCDVAPEVMLICGSHQLGGVDRRAGAGKSHTIKIGNGIWIGARSIVLGGAQLDDSSMYSAGTLVLGRSFPKNVLVGGHPATVLRSLDNAS